jgi:VWFA-related protein
VHVTLEVVAEFVRRASALNGDRILIFVSSGFLTVTPAAARETSQVMDLAAQSNVVISTLNARGVYSTELTASEHGTHVVMSGSTVQSHQDALTSAENALAELADGSGGNYFHNSNDLLSGFRQLAAEPQYRYLLQFSLDGVKPDGKYHRLRVKVNHDGLRLQAEFDRQMASLTPEERGAVWAKFFGFEGTVETLWLLRIDIPKADLRNGALPKLC